MTCPVCGRHASGRGQVDGFDIAVCDTCKHLFVHPMPTPAELDELYQSYGYGVDDPYPAFVDQLAAQLFGPFEPYRRSGRLLDVGFGAGTLLAAGHHAGWQVHGIEVSSAAVDRARSSALGEVIHGDVASAPWPDAHFDVVLLTETIEHVPDPDVVLAACARLLREGGLLFVTTPHAAGISGRLLRTRWSVVAPPEHLRLFTIRSLRTLLQRASLSASRIRTRGVHAGELRRALLHAHRAPRRTASTPASTTTTASTRHWCRTGWAAWPSAA